MKIIDPHVHLINRSVGDYFWLDHQNPPYWKNKKLIDRTHMLPDLSLKEPLELTGFVHIEAGFDNKAPWREITWLDGYVDMPFKTIGFSDLLSKDFSQCLERQIIYPHFVGVRHILEEEAQQILSHSFCKQHLSLLANSGLLFEAQINCADSASWQSLCRMLDQIPDLKVILTHSGLAGAQGKVVDQNAWKKGIKSLANYPNCAIKCSGWEINLTLNQNNHISDIVTYIVSEFGYDRTMLASNFPLCQMAMEYQSLWESYTVLDKSIRQNLHSLCYQTAFDWYQF
ncbi:amidohydrolase family protein [Algicola sagamiensis]|uniref:amidohydrolase family protein n=1 Tax=Algicola sagamiensis TaxID=163869 RepID=UPI00035EC9C7|nr:amidohydrolase family protein [Algicola sagamiensis]